MKFNFKGKWDKPQKNKVYTLLYYKTVDYTLKTLTKSLETTSLHTANRENDSKIMRFEEISRIVSKEIL